MKKRLLSLGAAAMAAALGFPLDAAALPSASGRSASDALAVAMLVCTPDGCRHRSKPYRARPAWNAYLMREYPPPEEETRAGRARDGGVLDRFFARPRSGQQRRPASSRGSRPRMVGGKRPMSEPPARAPSTAL